MTDVKLEVGKMNKVDFDKPFIVTDQVGDKWLLSVYGAAPSNRSTLCWAEKIIGPAIEEGHGL